MSFETSPTLLHLARVNEFFEALRDLKFAADRLGNEGYIAYVDQRSDDVEKHEMIEGHLLTATVAIEVARDLLRLPDNAVES